MRLKNNIFLVAIFSFFIFHFSFFTQSIAQRPKGYFLTDSIKVGLPFKFALSFKHRPESEVLFPDKNYVFAPFEVLKHEYFDTKTEQFTSLDSAVYTLVSFNLDTIQKLSLPVWIINERDCTAIYSTVRSVKLIQLIQHPQGLRLKDDTGSIVLKQQFNYPYNLLIIISIVLIFASIYGLFGKQIKRQWQLYQLYRNNNDFLKNFVRLKSKINKKSGLDNVEKVVVLWKKYLNRLENKPFETFTSKEIADHLSNEKLVDALKEIDAVVYGGASPSKIMGALAILENVATESYFRHRLSVDLAR
jgi:hypothetical protein